MDFPISQITYKHKPVDAGLVLGERRNLFDLSERKYPLKAKHTDKNRLLSKRSPQKSNFSVYIPVDSLTPGLTFKVLDRDYTSKHPLETTYQVLDITAYFVTLEVIQAGKPEQRINKAMQKRLDACKAYQQQEPIQKEDAWFVANPETWIDDFPASQEKEPCNKLSFLNYTEKPLTSFSTTSCETLSGLRFATVTPSLNCAKKSRASTLEPLSTFSIRSKSLTGLPACLLISSLPWGLPPIVRRSLDLKPYLLTHANNSSLFRRFVFMKNVYIKILVSISENRYDSPAPCEATLTLPVNVLGTVPIIGVIENLWTAALNDFSAEQGIDANLEREAVQEGGKP